MAYIGRQLARGENKLFDDISSSFNGSTTTFNLTVSSVATATATPYQLFVSLGGVMQKPNTDFTTAGNQITFTTAPAAGLSCWIMMQGDTIDNAAVADASITPSKISGSNFAFSGDLRLKDADGSHYVGFASPSSVTTNKVWTLPAADGSASTFLQTNGSGVLSWSGIGGASGIDFNDNVKTRWGTGNDLEIFHDGSHSYITNTTGDLKITDTSAMILATNSLRLKNGASDETYLAADNGSDVALYFNNSKKFETTNTGIAVTGAATISTDLTVTGDLTVSGTTTTINTQTLDVEDKNVVIGKVSTPSDTTADGGGWTLKGATDKTFNWVNATDAWTSSEHIHLIDNKKLLVGGASGTADGLEIVHNGSNSILNDAGTGTLQLQLGGSTKLEVTSGGINVTGAISVGGSPLSTAPEVTGTANGAIAANKPVIVHTDGTLKQVAATISTQTPAGVAPSSGTAVNGQVIQAAACQSGTAIAYDSANDTFGIAFRESNAVYFKLATRDASGSIDISVPSSAGTTQSGHTPSVCFDKSKEQFIVFNTKQTNDSNKIYAFKYTNSSKNAVQAAWNLEIASSQCQDAIIIYHDGISKPIVGYRLYNDDKVYIRIINVASDGTSATAESAFEITGSSTASVRERNFINMCYDPNRTSQLYIVTDRDSNRDLNIITLTLPSSGNSITREADTNIINGAVTDNRISNDIAGLVYDATIGKPVLYYKRTGDGKLYGIVITTSSTGVTSGAKQQLTSGTDSIGSAAAVYDELLEKTVVIFQDEGDSEKAKAFAVTFSGTETLTAGTQSSALTQGGDIGTGRFGPSAVWDSHMEQVVFMSRVTGDGDNRPRLFNVQSASQSTNMTTENFVGFSQAAYSNSATATISIVGNTSTQSSLTAGQKYYITKAGALSLTADTPSVVAGLALSATKLLIKPA